MKTMRTIIAAVIGLLAISVASSRGQVLTFSQSATLEGSLTNQTLINSENGNTDGKISSWVVSDSTVDSQGYIFIYQLENDGPDGITGLSFNDFNGSLATTPTIGGYSNGSYSSISISGNSASLLVPTSVTPSTSVPFNFQGVTTPGGAASFVTPFNEELANGGTESWFVVVYSDVYSFADGYALTQDNFQTYGNILAPIAATNPVPEPSSVILLTGGILCFYAILRCRRAMS